MFELNRVLCIVNSAVLGCYSVGEGNWLVKYVPWSIVMLLLLFVASSCSTNVKPGYIEEDKKACEAAIDLFHSRFNAENYEAIYDDAHTEFQKSMDRDALLAVMRETRNQFGPFKRVNDMMVNVIVGTPVQVRAVYVSEFENVDATELFLFVKEGDSLKLAMYRPSEGAVSLENIK